MRDPANIEQSKLPPCTFPWGPNHQDHLANGAQLRKQCKPGSAEGAREVGFEPVFGLEPRLPEWQWASTWGAPRLRLSPFRGLMSLFRYEPAALLKTDSDWARRVMGCLRRGRSALQKMI